MAAAGATLDIHDGTAIKAAIGTTIQAHRSFRTVPDHSRSHKERDSLLRRR